MSLSVETNNIITGITGGDKNATEQLIKLMNLPDEVFDKSYPDIKKAIEDAYKNQGVQKEMLQILMQNPAFDIEEEKQSIKELYEVIDDIEDLTENKKDLLKTAVNSASEELFNLMENPREKIPVKIKKLSRVARIPQYAHATDAGADVFALEKVVLKPHTTQLVRTGIAVAIPAGYEIQIRPRSGLSLKTPLRVANSVGTVDSSFRGEIKVIIENTGNLTQTIEAGDRIAQMLIAPTPMIKWEEVDELDETDRGTGGFGSTGS